MKNIALHRLTFAALLALFGLFFGLSALAGNNVYTSPFSGKWESASNWSLGAPSTNDSIFITNGTTKTVTVDATTVGSFSNTLAVTNFTVSAPGGFSNTLSLNNAGTNVPLLVSGTVGVYANGILNVSNSTLMMSNSLHGSLLDVGSVGGGTMNFSSGLMYADSMDVGGHGNSSGVLNLNGGTFNAGGFGNFAVSSSLNSTGLVSVAGCTLNVGGSGLFVGLYGVGQFNLNSGSVRTPYALIGNGGAVGNLVINGGTFVAQQYLIDGNYIGYDSVIVNTNGSLYVTNAAHSAFLSIGINSTLTLNGGFMQLDNLILTNGGSFTNLSGTLVFTKPFQVENGSSVIVSGSGGVINTPYNFTMGTSLGSTGSVLVTSRSTLNITNASLGIGNDGSLTNGSGTGIATVSNATVNVATVNLGSSAGGIGTLTLQPNAVLNLTSNLTVVSSSLSQTSLVTVTGGTINATNSTLAIGPSGSGEMDMYSGNVNAKKIKLGGTGSSGHLILQGGTIHTAAFFANFMVVDGGDLDGTGGTITIGEGHEAAMEVDSGTVRAGTIFVGYSPDFTGTYTQNGGVVNVFTNLVVGDCNSGALGDATLNGGFMYVTNANNTAVLDVRNGTFTLNAGATLVVDTLILTNSCGHFVNLGGTLVTNNAPILATNLDADGDGQSNGAEAAAGTDPFNPNDLFQMMGVTVSNKDVRVYWTTSEGHNYVVQTNGSLGASGFHNLSSPISVPLGTGTGVTNFLHQNALTNRATFYRVWLSP